MVGGRLGWFVIVLQAFLFCPGGFRLYIKAKHLISA